VQYLKVGLILILQGCTKESPSFRRHRLSNGQDQARKVALVELSGGDVHGIGLSEHLIHNLPIVPQEFLPYRKDESRGILGKLRVQDVSKIEKQMNEESSLTMQGCTGQGHTVTGIHDIDGIWIVALIGTRCPTELNGKLIEGIKARIGNRTVLFVIPRQLDLIDHRILGMVIQKRRHGTLVDIPDGYNEGVMLRGWQAMEIGYVIIMFLK